MFEQRCVCDTCMQRILHELRWLLTIANSHFSPVNTRDLKGIYIYIKFEEILFGHSKVVMIKTSTLEDLAPSVDLCNYANPWEWRHGMMQLEVEMLCP